MKKAMLILLLVILVCGAGLVLISLPIDKNVSNLTVTLDDGTQGTLEIVTPRFLRLGDKARVTLGITLTPEKETSSDKSVKIKAILQSTTLEMEPMNAVTAVISAGGNGQFQWAVTGHTSEEQRATLWCFRQGAAGPELILARDLSFEVKTILGMRFQFIRWILVEIMLLCALLIGVTFFRMRHF